MMGWWRNSATRNPTANAKPAPTTATATTPATTAPTSTSDSRRPLPHRPTTAVATIPTPAAATEPPICQRIPAAVTAQLVSAAGTSRRSILLTPVVSDPDKLTKLLQPRRADAVNIAE